MEDFVQKSIIFRFGLPHTIITDNQDFRDFYAKFHITH